MTVSKELMLMFKIMVILNTIAIFLIAVEAQRFRSEFTTLCIEPLHLKDCLAPCLNQTKLPILNKDDFILNISSNVSIGR